MARNKKLVTVLPVLTRRHSRAMKTFGERVTVGTEVAGDPAKSRQQAVKNAATKFKRSERYVWGTVKLGSKMYAAALAIVEEEASRNKCSRPRTAAALFLLNKLRNEPKPMKEVEALARRSGIAISTLRRASKVLDVKKRHVGGRQGHWTWELPLDVKKSFGIKVKDDHL